MRWMRTRTALAIAGTATLVYILGCGASGQLEPQLAPSAVREAEKCLQDGPCFFLHVTNDGDYQIVVRLNGWKVGEVEGHASESFSVSEHKLRDGRCASVSLWVIGPASKLFSDRQCIREGGYFSLQLDVQYHVWLTPWGGR